MPNTAVMPPVRLVLADDHPLMLQALMALEAVGRFQPDMLELDGRMAYMDGMRLSNK